jgi:hypothetical protein
VSFHDEGTGMGRRAATGLRTQANPFIPGEAPPPPEEAVEPDSLWNGQMSLEGPSSPESAPLVDVSAEEPWPVIEITDRPLVTVMGLHGGSGASLVAALLGADALDVGRAWPVFTGWDRPAPSLPVVVTARTNYEGVAAASRFARLWAGETLPDSTLLGIVLIDDGPKLSSQQRSVVRRIGQMTPHGWHLPWNESWRLSKPSAEASSLRVRRIVSNIRSLAQSTNGDIS